PGDTARARVRSLARPHAQCRTRSVARPARAAPVQLGAGSGEQRSRSAYPPSAPQTGRRPDSDRARRGLYGAAGESEPMRLLPRSLQGRLLILVLGVVTGVWLATAAMTWRDVRHELDELLDSHLAQAAALLVVQQASEVGDDHEAADVPTLHRYAPKVAFQVFHEGRLALRSPNAPDLPMAGGKSFNPGFATVTIEGITWRVFAAQGAERDVQVNVSERVDSRASILWAVLRSTLWPMLVALPLLALVSWWAVYRGMAPLRKLGRSVAERQPQALQPVVVAGAPSEMVPLVDALNGLFDRIARMIESE